MFEIYISYVSVNVIIGECPVRLSLFVHITTQLAC